MGYNLHCLTLQIKALWSFETLGTNQTQHHIPHRLNPKQHGCKNLKSRLPPPLQKKKTTHNMIWVSHSQTV